MHTVDRKGVHIEQCQGCRGIFLDRGELEQISTAEQTHYTAGAPRYRGDSPPAHRGGYRDSPPAHVHGSHSGHYRDSPPAHGTHGSHGGHHRDSPPPYGHKHRRRGFLEELFD